MSATTQSVGELERQAKELSAMEVAVETNAGTFGAIECCRKTGSGDPRYGTYTIYLRVGDGARRTVGCDPASAPGYARKGGYDVFAAKQRELAALRKQIAAMKRDRSLAGR